MLVELYNEGIKVICANNTFCSESVYMHNFSDTKLKLYSVSKLNEYNGIHEDCGYKIIAPSHDIASMGEGDNYLKEIPFTSSIRVGNQ